MARKEDKIQFVISSDPSASHTHTPVEDVLAKDAPFPSNELTGNKEEKWEKEEMKRSNSHTSSGNNIGDPTSNIKQITIGIPSDPSPSSTHAQTPLLPQVTSSSTPPRQDISSLKRHLLLHVEGYAFWDQAEAIFNAFPDMIRTPLNGHGETTLHVVVRREFNESDFVKKLVNRMTPQDLEIRDSYGNTAFYLAVVASSETSRNVEISLKYMIEKNPNLYLIRGKGGLLPVESAVVRGNEDVIQYLTSDHLLQKMDINDIQNLFLITVRFNIFDVAMELFEKDPTRLIIARDDKEETALHMLARKPPPHEFYELLFAFGEEVRWHDHNRPRWRDHLPKLRNRLLSEVGQLEDKEVMELLTKSSAILFDAVISANLDIVTALLRRSPPELWVQKDSDGRTILQCAVLYRRRDILDHIIRYSPAGMLIVLEVDNDGNNVLHLAAHVSKQAFSGSKPYSQMPEDKKWFKEVERQVPRELRIMRNKKGETPKDTFDADHKELYEKFKEEVKGIANSGMVVAALIATVAFAAALTVPGDKNSVSFVVFILINATALFTSSASIIYFLSVFTSLWTKPKELLNDISVKLIKQGRQCLMISVVAMVISFIAASFLIFGHKHKWVAYLVTLMGLPPVILLLIRQADLYIDRLFRCLWLILLKFLNPMFLYFKIHYTHFTPYTKE